MVQSFFLIKECRAYAILSTYDLGTIRISVVFFFFYVAIKGIEVQGREHRIQESRKTVPRDTLLTDSF